MAYPPTPDVFDTPSNPTTTPSTDPGDTSPARDRLELEAAMGASITATQTELETHKAAANPHSAYATDADLLGLIRPRRASGAMYYDGHGVPTTLVTVQNRLYLMPFWVGATESYNLISVELVSVGGAGAVVRLGIFTDDGSGKPDNVLLDAGTVDVSASTVVKSIVINQQLTPGLWWTAAVSQAGASEPTLRATNGGAFGSAQEPTGFSGKGGGWYKSSVSGALANIDSAPTGVRDVMPIVTLRRS